VYFPEVLPNHDRFAQVMRDQTVLGHLGRSATLKARGLSMPDVAPDGPVISAVSEVSAA
jgi:hypothetical protein